MKNNSTVIIGVRFRKDTKDALKKHFESKGLLHLSEGIRRIILEYIRKEKIKS